MRMVPDQAVESLTDEQYVRSVLRLLLVWGLGKLRAAVVSRRPGLIDNRPQIVESDIMSDQWKLNGGYFEACNCDAAFDYTAAIFR